MLGAKLVYVGGAPWSCEPRGRSSFPQKIQFRSIWEVFSGGLRKIEVWWYVGFGGTKCKNGRISCGNCGWDVVEGWNEFQEVR